MRPGHPPALRLRGLHKRFGDNVAVDHLDLTGTVGGQVAGAAKLSAFIESGSWCIYSFFAI